MDNLPTLPPSSPKDLMPTLAPATLSGPDSAAPSAPPGYELLDVLGRGGMGVVYKARQIKLDRLVALKMILSGPHAGTDDRMRFRTEAEAMGRLQHPNVVQVYEVGEHEGRPFLAMEFCAAGSLDARLAGTPLPPGAAARLVETLARALASAHWSGIVHRDLKPANVLLAVPSFEFQVLSGEGAAPAPLTTQNLELTTFTPKVSDFGLARRLDSDAGHTRTGAVLGTPSYMAPEQADGRGKEAGPPADIWALGAILYECLTGRPPFKAATPLDTLLQVVSEEPVPPARLAARIPRDLETICLKCLQKEPAKRYASAEALADDLKAFLEGRPIAARPVGRLARLGRWARRNPKLAAVSTVAMLLTLVIVIFGPPTVVYLGQMNERLQATVYSQRIGLAHREWLEGNVPGAERQLNQIAPEQRGRWEERYVRSLLGAHLYEQQHERGHQAAVIALKLSPDGKRLATARADGTLRFHDLEGGPTRDVTPVDGAGPFGAVAFTAALDRLAFAGPGDAIRLCDDQGRVLKMLKGHQKDVLALDWSADGARLVSAGEDGRLKLWDVAAGRELADVDLGGRPMAVSLAPDGRRAAVTRDSAATQVWDLGAGKPLFTLDPPPHAWQGIIVAWGPDGTLLATGHDGDSAVRLWDARTGREKRALVGHVSGIFALAFSPDGRHLASVGGTQSVKVWDIVTGREVVRYRGHANLVRCVAFGPDGATLATGDAAGAVKVWDATDGQEAVSLQPAPFVRALRFSPDGRDLAAGEAGRVRLWYGDDAVGWGHRWFAFPAQVFDVAFRPDGKYLAAAGQGGRLHLYDLETSREAGAYTDHAPDAVAVAWSPDGRLMASMGGDGAVHVRDGADGRVLRTLHLTAFDLRDSRIAPWMHLAFHPDGRRLAVGFPTPQGGGVRLFDADTGQDLGLTASVPVRVAGLDFARDGRLRVASTLGHLVEKALDRGPATTRLFHGQMYDHFAAAVSPDGGRFASIDQAGTVKLWDADSGHELLTLRFRRSERGPIVFSPDGRRLAAAITGGEGYGELRVWEAVGRSPQERRRLHASRLPVWLRNQAADNFRAGHWPGVLFAIDRYERRWPVDRFLTDLRAQAREKGR